MIDPIEHMRRISDEQAQTRMKPFYDILNSPIYTRKFKRQLLDFAIENQSNMVLELTEIRRMI